MDDQKSYAAPVPVGGVMEGEVIAQVLAPEAFIGMLQGRNFGKLLVRVASPR
jgi:NADPH-dependent curcumin reductase CurA